MKAFKKYNVMLGSDPELLLTKTVVGRTKFFPIIGLLGHGKKDPLHIDQTGFRTLQEDNVALEYTTHPTSTKEDWLTEQKLMYENARTFARAQDLEVAVNEVAVSFDTSMLASDQARTFGCEPSWNCYKNAENPAPPATGTIRSVGGHVHISYDGHTPEKSMELVKLLDLVLVLSNKASLPGRGESARRRLYGRAGEARLKDYGVEWRVPSSKWVHTVDGRSAIWDIVEEAFELFAAGRTVETSYHRNIIANINSGTRLSRAVEHYLKPLPAKPKPVKKKPVPKVVAKKPVKKTTAKAAPKKVSRKLTVETIPF